MSPRYEASSGCGWRNGLRYGVSMRIYRISSCGQPTRGGPLAWGLGEVLTTPHRKNWPWYLCLRPGLIFWYDLNSVKGTLRFGTWNVRSLYRSGSLATVTRELARYKLDLVGVQEVRWDKGGTVRAGDYIFSVEKKKKIINWEQFFCTPLLSALCWLLAFLCYFLITLLTFLIFLLCFF